MGVRTTYFVCNNLDVATCVLVVVEGSRQSAGTPIVIVMYVTQILRNLITKKCGVWWCTVFVYVIGVFSYCFVGFLCNIKSAK